MLRLHANRFVDAIFKVMLLSAAVHIVILVCMAIWQRNIAVLNYFAIIGLGDALPGLSYTWPGHVVAALTVAALYLFFLLKR